MKEVKEFKEVLKVMAYAEGYYSGQSYYEAVYLPVEYEELLEKSDLKLYICELDGKHSEVKADIEMYVVSVEDILKTLEEGNDGEDLLQNIKYLECLDIDKLNKDLDEVATFLGSLDYLVKISFEVKKSQVESVQNFVKSLQTEVI